jgi:hypothetical protein
MKLDVLDMAKRECKGDATEQEVQWLLQPENHYSWCQALITALSDFDSQVLFHKTRLQMLAHDAELGVTPREEYLMEKEKFEGWLRKSTRYRNGISQRLGEVKTLLGNHPALEHIEENARLMRAIADHRRAARDGQFGEETHDLKLWATIIEQ